MKTCHYISSLYKNMNIVYDKLRNQDTMNEHRKKMSQIVNIG